LDLNTGVEIALEAMYSQRLAVLCGAGLSMASPSNVPSAATLAARAKKKYDDTYGAGRAPLPEGIEDQANFFFEKDELASIYLQRYIDFHAFAGPFNEGHCSVADLLLVRGIQVAVSTNVDSMIEAAGSSLLHGQIGTGIDVNGVAALAPNLSPLLKIHGCWTSDRGNTIWTPSQLAKEPVASRIAGSRDWLKTQLLNRDIVIVGYFTDWDYLNAVLGQAVGTVTPSRVIVVDPSDGATLALKAPQLYALGNRAAKIFGHVQSSGDVFLKQLRDEFSRGFVRRMMSKGQAAFEKKKGENGMRDSTEPSGQLTLTDGLVEVQPWLPWQKRASKEHPNVRRPQSRLVQTPVVVSMLQEPLWLMRPWWHRLPEGLEAFPAALHPPTKCANQHASRS
jgi:hypothetical protein